MCFTTSRCRRGVIRKNPASSFTIPRSRFAEVFDEAQRIAGYLQQRCGVRKGDRVLLFMQNSPQFVIAYYGILRADAVVVPLNPMNLTQEFLRCARDAGAHTVVVSQELYPRIEPLIGGADLEHAIVAAYSDYLRGPTDLPGARLHFRATDGTHAAGRGALARCAAERVISGTVDDRTR